jgi:DNA-binding transcriptional ArsR family regulator
VTLLDSELPPVLVYPALRPDLRPERFDGSRQALAALLGTTRAAALAAIGDGCSTTDLARRVGVSAAAASQHATVLRNAGLITSHRDRNVMMHTVTALVWPSSTAGTLQDRQNADHAVGGRPIART